MFRAQYDGDATTWSPQGRLHQVEYAMEAVKQGTACVGIRSKTHAVLVALKRTQSELASYQKKILKIDDHVGIAIAGLTSDARVLSQFMRQECLNSKFNYERPMPLNRLSSAVASWAQTNTQHYGRRPFGVGLIVAGYDSTGPHIYENDPAGNKYEYVGLSIGSRSQSARTYLEKNMNSFDSSSPDELCRHALIALRDSLPQGIELDSKNCSLAIVGLNTPFSLIENELLVPYLSSVNNS